MHIQTENWTVEVTLTDRGPELEPEVIVKSTPRGLTGSSAAFFCLKKQLDGLPDSLAYANFFGQPAWKEYLANAPTSERVTLEKAFRSLKRVGVTTLGSVRSIKPTEIAFVRRLGPKSTKLIEALFNLQ